MARFGRTGVPRLSVSAPLRRSVLRPVVGAPADRRDGSPAAHSSPLLLQCSSICTTTKREGVFGQVNSVPGAQSRPTSPHVTVYAFPVVALSSITVRITGVLLTVGASMLRSFHTLAASPFLPSPSLNMLGPPQGARVSVPCHSRTRHWRQPFCRRLGPPSSRFKQPPSLPWPFLWCTTTWVPAATQCVHTPPLHCSGLPDLTRPGGGVGFRWRCHCGRGAICLMAVSCGAVLGHDCEGRGQRLGRKE